MIQGEISFPLAVSQREAKDRTNSTAASRLNNPVGRRSPLLAAYYYTMAHLVKRRARGLKTWWAALVRMKLRRVDRLEPNAPLF